MSGFQQGDSPSTAVEADALTGDENIEACERE